MLEEKVLIKVLRDCLNGKYPHLAAPDNKYVDALIEIGFIIHEPYGNPDYKLSSFGKKVLNLIDNNW